MFPDRELPDEYERSMAAVFPDDHPGAFTYRSSIGKWIWTTFHNYQWDLNYENPTVLNRMLEEALFLANQGVEILRMDAVAFLGKRRGTSCQNLPESHSILRAMNAAVQIAAPATVFKSEAIVHPDEVKKYIDLKECQLSYDPQLMALLWNSLATRDIRSLKQAMEKRFEIGDGCEWVNYLRCHDDIGWAFSDNDIASFGFDTKTHRRFLTDFYCGRFPGSFARGLPFQEDRTTGDARVSGTCASLVGLEKSIHEKDEQEIDLSVRRIHLLHGVMVTMGGIPLIYLGDEIATLNDYAYENNADKAGDSRWLHRNRFDWERAEERNSLETIVGRVHAGILRLIRLREQTRAFDRAKTELVDTGNDHVLGYFRSSADSSVLVLANFSEHAQTVEGRHLRMLGLRRTVIDILSGQTVTAMHELSVEPYQMLVLARPL
jgi:amylosucrase/maltose alpha-D-glucosyltransferase/alpha-amylase